MTVFRNRQRGGRWAYDFRVKGRRYAGYCVDPATGESAKTKSRALEMEGALKQQVRTQPHVVSSAAFRGGFTFAEAVLLHLEAQAGNSAGYVANQRLYSRELLRYFGEATPVVAITQKHVDDYRVWCLEQPLKVWKGGALKSRDRRHPRWWGTVAKTRSPASSNHYLKCLRAALQQAHRARDTVTGQPCLPFPPEVKPIVAPKRRPRPMPDAELAARMAKAPPWVREVAELARLFGLRRAECLAVRIRNLDADVRGLRFSAEEVKGGADQHAYGGPEGWALLRRLAAQAERRGVDHLITWPGPSHWRRYLEGAKVPAGAWVPLKSIRRAWRTTAAGIDTPHRLHDVRARYVTEVAKVAPSAVAQGAARHADPGTTARYVAVASVEVAQAVDRARRPNLPAWRTIKGGRRK
jgi:integrase